MASTTPVKTARTIIATISRGAGAAATQGVLDMRTVHGGLLTLKITNAGTLAAQCQCNVLVAHTTDVTPAAASAGTVWKTLWSFSGGLTSGVTTEQSISIDAATMHLEVEFVGNTTSACTVEAYLSEITSFNTY
jgi:Flp pilus assembly protein TadG